MKRILLLFFIILLFSDCANIFQRKPLSLEDVTVQKIRSRVEENYWKLKSIKGRAHLSIESPEMGFTAFSNISLKLPDLLNVEVKAGLGFGVGSILVRDDQFVVYSSMENVVYYGDIQSFNLNKIGLADIQLDELMGLAAGLPLIPASGKSNLTIDDNKYVITLQSENIQKKYWIDPKKFVVTNFNIYKNDNQLFVQQEFSQFKKERGVYLPKVIKITRPEGRQRVTLFYTDRSTNKKINSDEFTIKIPDNAQKIKL